eukprot:175922_1
MMDELESSSSSSDDDIPMINNRKRKLNSSRASAQPPRKQPRRPQPRNDIPQTPFPSPSSHRKYHKPLTPWNQRKKKVVAATKKRRAKLPPKTDKKKKKKNKTTKRKKKSKHKRNDEANKVNVNTNETEQKENESIVISSKNASKPRKKNKTTKRKKKSKHKRNDEANKVNVNTNETEQKENESIVISSKNASKPRKKKPKTKPKKGKANNEFEFSSLAAKWLHNIKTMYKGQFKDSTSIEVGTANVGIGKNYYCCDCGKSYKAHQERDIVTHLVSGVHEKNVKRGKAVKRGSMKSYVASVRKIMFDWMFDAMKFNVSASAMTGIANSFVAKHCPPKVRNNIVRNESRWSHEVDFMTQSMDKKVSWILQQKRRSPWYHWCFLCDEGEGNKKGVMIAHTAFNCHDRPLLTTAKVLKSSSNSASVTKTFMENIRENTLDVDKARLILMDGVAYNTSSLVGILALCPFFTFHSLCVALWRNT